MKSIGDLDKNLGLNGQSLGPGLNLATIEPATPVSLDTLQITHPLVQVAIDAARSWSVTKRSGDAPGVSLVLAGPVGTGKTHIASAVLWTIRHVMSDGSPISPVGIFRVANDLIQRLDNATEMATIIFKSCPIVVVDDVGSEQNIPYVAAENQAREVEQRYFRLINFCYTERISLVLTTNLSLEALGRVVGARAWSRLQEMAPKGLMVDMVGVPDYRRKSGGRA